jgi:predicted lipoprotein with Yx(FWY)xxD motif
MGRLRLAGGALPLILLLAACSSGGATSAPSVAAPSTPAASPSSPAASPSSPAASPSDTASPDDSAEIELKVVAGAGSVPNYLTGADGKTLYIFTKDTKDSGKSVCNGDCATNWPPLLADTTDAVKADSGVTGKLAIITRDDGGKQVSYNGMPLYYFAADTAAGDVKGQGVGGVWFVANP